MKEELKKVIFSRKIMDKLHVLRRLLAIDIEDFDEMIRLLQLIYEQSYTKDEADLQSDEDPDEADAEEVYLKFNPDVILSILTDYIDDKSKKNIDLAHSEQKKQKLEKMEKEKKAKEDKKKWESLTQVLPAETFHIWGVLDKAQSRYYKLLLDRQKLIEETGELHSQHQELKGLLRQYLQVKYTQFVGVAT
jgi:Sperm tail C-terminal domain